MNQEIKPILEEGDSAPQGPRPMHSLAISGFIAAFFCGIVGLILSIKARGQINASDGALGGYGFTTAGIIVSIVSLIMNTLWVLAEIAAA